MLACHPDGYIWLKKTSRLRKPSGRGWFCRGGDLKFFGDVAHSKMENTQTADVSDRCR